MKLPDEVEKAFAHHGGTVGILRQRCIAREKASHAEAVATEAYQVAIDDEITAREALRKAIADALAKVPDAR